MIINVEAVYKNGKVLPPYHRAVEVTADNWHNGSLGKLTGESVVRTSKVSQGQGYTWTSGYEPDKPVAASEGDWIVRFASGNTVVRSREGFHERYRIIGWQGIAETGQEDDSMVVPGDISDPTAPAWVGKVGKVKKRVLIAEIKGLRDTLLSLLVTPMTHAKVCLVAREALGMSPGEMDEYISDQPLTIKQPGTETVPLYVFQDACEEVRRLRVALRKGIPGGMPGVPAEGTAGDNHMRMAEVNKELEL